MTVEFWAGQSSEQVGLVVWIFSPCKCSWGSSEAEVWLLSSPLLHIQNITNVYKVQKIWEVLDIDHYYILLLTENGPRIGEIKSIFLGGRGKKNKRKKKRVYKELFWTSIHFFHHLAFSFKTGVCLPEWDIFQSNLIVICFRVHTKTTDQK